MRRQSILASLIFCFFSSTVHAVLGDRSSMEQACRSSQVDLKRLCAVVDAEFNGELQDEYIHLGGDYYLVSVPNIARAGQGIYVANIGNKKINMYGGYGIPKIGKQVLLPEGRLVILQKQSDMSLGRYAEITSEIQVRNNPITKTPYLVSQDAAELNDVSEEIRGFCSDKSNSRHPDCEDKKSWGKTVKHTTGQTGEQIIRAHAKALAVYKSKTPAKIAPYAILEKAGVRSIIDRKPDDISLAQYVNILNDYAFFAYKYDEGRTTLAIEILDKVIRLAPERKPAYLNMAQALEYLAKESEAERAEIPLAQTEVAILKSSAKEYFEKYNALK